MNDLERDLRTMYARREADLSGVRFAPAEAPPEVVSRIRRRQVGVVLGGLVVTGALVLGAVTGTSALLRSSEHPVPANPTETPAPAPGTPIRPESLSERFDVAGAWGETGGVGWAVWTNAELSCLAFTGGTSGDYSGDAAESGGSRCLNGYDGTDLKLTGACAYACPVPRHPVLYGTVSPRVARVEFLVDDGTMYAGTIHPTPADATVDGRVFTLSVDRPNSFTGTLTALGSDGSVLGQIRWPGDADRPGGTSMPIVVEATLASGVPTDPVDGRPLEDERWEVAIWRTSAGEWCFGTIYPADGRAVVASDEPACGTRDDLFGRRDPVPIDHADVWWTPDWNEDARWFGYRVVGTVSSDVASVRLELEDGQVVQAELYDPQAGFEDLGRLFLAEFRSRHHPWVMGGTGGIAWIAVALDADGRVLDSDAFSM